MGILPYIQDIPMRIRAIRLDAEERVLWKELQPWAMAAWGERRKRRQVYEGTPGWDSLTEGVTAALRRQNPIRSEQGDPVSRRVIWMPRAS